MMEISHNTTKIYKDIYGAFDYKIKGAVIIAKIQSIFLI